MADESGECDSVRPETDRLLLDAMLGKLAAYLRVCGYDASYALDRGIEADGRLAELALREDRRLLTRDRALAERVDGAIRLDAKEVEGQLSELHRAGIALEVADEPTRCGRCNGPLDPVAPEADTPEYAPDPTETDCWRCRTCGQVFWKGSHHERMAETIDRVT